MAALVLLRIAFWYAKARSQGRDATAQSVSDLMRETAGTKKQVQRVLDLLREKGLIAARRGFFGARNVNNWYVTEPGQHALQGTFEQPLEGTFEQPLNGALHIQGESTLSDNMEMGVPVHAGEIGGSPDDGCGKGKAMKPVKPRHSSVKDAVMSAQNTDLKIANKVHKPDSVSGLEKVWQQTVAEVTGAFVPPLLMKDKGQLKHFRSQCPPHRSEDVIAHAVRNWIDFVKTVESQAGVKKTPAAPSIGFLLKHAAIAVNLFLESRIVVKHEEKPAGISAAKPVQLISQTPSAPAEAAPKSLAELMSILNDEED
jgi:hypothetical protein